MKGRHEQPRGKKPAVAFGDSFSEDDGSLPKRLGPKSAVMESVQRLSKKQTSSREEFTRILQNEKPFDGDVETDDGDIDECAIYDNNDDESSDWEDLEEGIGYTCIDYKSFQRIDSRPNLISGPSLITTMLHQKNPVNFPANAASKSTLEQPPGGSSNGGLSLAASVEPDDGDALTTKTVLKVGRTRTQPTGKTATNNRTHPLALSPRTTRLNILAAELTVSLRKNLLWERQQMTQTSNVVRKRRSTSHDLATVEPYPKKTNVDNDENNTNAYWNQYFSQGLDEYHSTGW
jgi:hypothetical protein